MKGNAIIRNIDPAIWREFKKLCVDENKTINDKLLELIRQAVERK